MIAPADEVRADRREACRLPERLTPSQWAERDRVLSRSESAEAGPWRNARTPYLAGLMDAICEPGVEDVALAKSTQIGGSEALRNVIGYWISEDPGPCLIVMPSEQAVKELLEERIKPLILNSPALRKHWSGDPHDITQTGVKLDTMPIYFGWAGSPQSLATRPCRFVVFDEVDKFPPYSGREADPISLGIERTATWGHRRRILRISTPTTREGAIWKAWEAAGDKRRYVVPCPYCGELKPWAFAQVKWPKLEGDKATLADMIERGKLAWYECPACRKRIEDHQKPKMLAAGSWVSEGIPSKRIALHYNAVGSPWRTFSEIAGQFIRAASDPGATMNFRNSWLAEPFEDVVTRTQASVVREKSPAAPPQGSVPKWCQALVATADTQKDWFAVCIRAWGWGYRSQLVYYGECRSFDELYHVALESQFAVEGGGVATPAALLIDSGGNRTDEVYQFALRDPGRIYPTKGASMTMRKPWTVTQLPSGVVLRMVDTNHFKDMLARLITDPDPTKWLPHRDVTDQYCLEMAGEHKVLDRKNGRMTWQPKSSGQRVEAWDCETLQCAAADMANIGAAPAEPAIKSQQAEPSEPFNPMARAPRW